MIEVGRRLTGEVVEKFDRGSGFGQHRSQGREGRHPGPIAVPHSQNIVGVLDGLCPDPLGKGLVGGSGLELAVVFGDSLRLANHADHVRARSDLVKELDPHREIPPIEVQDVVAGDDVRIGVDEKL